MTAYKSLESANALAAFQIVYFNRFSRLVRTKKPCHHRRNQMGEIGDDVNHHTRAVDSKVIGRQAFLLDEPLRHKDDGRILRLPLVQGDGATPSSREERTNGALEDDEEDRDLSKYGWKLGDDDWEGAWEYEKQCVLQRRPTRLAMSPTCGLVRVDYDSSSGLGIAHRQPIMGESSDTGADAVYREYVDEGQCCSLGGWLNGS